MSKPLLYPSVARKLAKKWLERQGYKYPMVVKVSLEGEWTVEAIVSNNQAVIIKFDSKGNFMSLKKKRIRRRRDFYGTGNSNTSKTNT